VEAILMSWTSYPETLADTVLLAVVGSDCEPCRVTVTAGEPAAPAGNDNAAWVWIDSAYAVDSPFLERGAAASCLTRTALNLRVRVDVCYPEQDDGSDQTDAQHAATHECLHGLMESIWCAIAADPVSAVGAENCRKAGLDRWQVGERLGGIVSATLSLAVEVDCAQPTS
jgi:hypothetical protein